MDTNLLIALSVAGLFLLGFIIAVFLWLHARRMQMEKAIDALREQFANLAAEKLADKSYDLSRLNSEQLENALKPLREQVESLQSLTVRAQTQSEHLERDINANVDEIAKIAMSLVDTTNALKSNIRVQGRVGEDILEEKLRQAGMEEGLTFFLQKGNREDRPDAQVCDPQNRFLIIDSKVNLANFFAYSEEEEVDRKTKFLDAHVRSVRQQIDSLSKKQYPRKMSEQYPERNYLPTTAMFVPYEEPLRVAIERDPSIVQYAADQNIVIVTPLTLLAYLRLVYLAWQHEKELEGQQKIIDASRELLYRTNKFLSQFEELGDAINAARNKYNEVGKVFIDSENSQSIAKSAQKLIDLGVALESPKHGGRKPEPAKCIGEKHL